MIQYPEVEVLPVTIPIEIGDLGVLFVHLVIVDASRGIDDTEEDLELFGGYHFTPEIVAAILPGEGHDTWAVYDYASNTRPYSGHLVDCVDWAYNHYQTKTNRKENN